MGCVGRRATRARWGAAGIPAGTLSWSLVLLGTGCTGVWAGPPRGAVGDAVPSFFAGESLQLANEAPAPAEAGEQRVHVVQPGETLWRIARSYGTTPEALAEANGIVDMTQVRAGTELRVPGAAVTVASLSPAPSPKPQSRDYPLRWPVQGKLTSRFGQRGERPHDGVDIGAAPGTSVRAAAAGEVIFSGVHGGYGNLVLIKHRDGLVTVYAHNSVNLVRKGQAVRQGDLVAKVGATGRATGPHLHFEVRHGVKPKNPLAFLPP